MRVFVAGATGAIGQPLVMMTELGWCPAHPSWREGLAA